MTVENLATIMVPSLYDCSALIDPLEALTLLEQLQNFFSTGVRWRQTVIDKSAFEFESEDSDSNADSAPVNNPANGTNTNLDTQSANSSGANDGTPSYEKQLGGG